MKLSHLKNIIRKTLKEANLNEDVGCPDGCGDCSKVAGGCADAGGYCKDCDGGCQTCVSYGGGGEIIPLESLEASTGGFTPDTPDFAKNMPRAINVRPTTLTEDKNTTMKLSRLKQIIKEHLKTLPPLNEDITGGCSGKPCTFTHDGVTYTSTCTVKSQSGPHGTCSCHFKGLGDIGCGSWKIGPKGPAEPMGRPMG